MCFLLIESIHLASHAELHDRVHNIAVCSLQRRDGLSTSGATNLLENELNMLGINTTLINGLVGSGRRGSLGIDERRRAVFVRATSSGRSGLGLRQLSLKGRKLLRLL